MHSPERDDADDLEAQLERIDVTARLDDTIATLEPAPPICLTAEATVRDAIGRMLDHRQACVLVVDGAERLAGIFTERDVLTRVLGQDRDPARTRLGEVMTPSPEALTRDHRVAYAVHCLSVAGYRTIPLVDDEDRPLGVVTATDFIRWVANLFPEAILNLPPGGVLKRPGDLDAG